MFAANIRTRDWGEFFTANDSDLTSSIIYKSFQSLLNQYLKTKIFTCQKNNNWLPKKLKHHLRNLERSYHRIPTFGVLINLRNAHKNVETRRSLIFEMEEEISAQYSNKSRATARLLNRRMNKSKTENIANLFLANGITLEGDEQAENALNTFFPNRSQMSRTPNLISPPLL